MLQNYSGPTDFPIIEFKTLEQYGLQRHTRLLFSTAKGISYRAHEFGKYAKPLRLVDVRFWITDEDESKYLVVCEFVAFTGFKYYKVGDIIEVVVDYKGFKKLGDYKIIGGHCGYHIRLRGFYCYPMCLTCMALARKEQKYAKPE